MEYGRCVCTDAQVGCMSHGHLTTVADKDIQAGNSDGIEGQVAEQQQEIGSVKYQRNTHQAQQEQHCKNGLTAQLLFDLFQI